MVPYGTSQAEFLATSNVRRTIWRISFNFPSSFLPCAGRSLGYGPQMYVNEVNLFYICLIFMVVGRHEASWSGSRFDKLIRVLFAKH
jgi:hypothetical protein